MASFPDQDAAGDRGRLLAIHAAASTHCRARVRYFQFSHDVQSAITFPHPKISTSTSRAFL
jgi:hypothetical protein